MTLTQFKRAVRSYNIERILHGVTEFRTRGLTENEIFRLALAGEPMLDRRDWNDLVQPEPEYGLGYMQGRGAS